MTPRARRGVPGTMAIGLLALALGVTGLAGAYSYWQSYFLHRGFAAVALVRGAGRGRLVHIRFGSAALHRQADYLAYLPPGYSAAQTGPRYPVYVLLHGSPGQDSVYLAIVSIGIRMDNLIREHRMQPMILVFPNGTIGGSLFSDSEWANTRSGAYENYVVEVVHDLDHRFHTLSARAHRVIAGFSAGAYGAANITLHHLAVFGNLQTWSGYFRQSRVGVFAHASAPTLANNSPLDEVPRLTTRLAVDPLRAFLFAGRDDNASPQTIRMASALAAAGANVSYALYPGGHDWQLWKARVDQMLMLASQDATEPLIGGLGRANSLTPGVIALPHGIGRRHHRPRRAHRRQDHRPRRAHRRRHRELGASRYHGGASGTDYVAGTVPVSAPRAHHHRSDPLRVGRLLVGLLLALGSAALINLGFLLQHRGLRAGAAGGLTAALRGAWRSPSWLAGQGLGWTGFAAQIVAVAIAPLSLVQSFAAGGLALSVPLAAWRFHHRVTRAQALAVVVMAAGLAVLPVGFGTGRDHLHAGALTVVVTAGVLLALVLCAAGTAGRALAAGTFYGVADAAIKAISVRWSAHGPGALLSAWSVVAALGTLGGFVAFQAALRDGSAIVGISLMTALSAIVALGGGLVAFQESLGSHPLVMAAHLAAIGIVLVCVPVLARVQVTLADGPDSAPAPAGGRRRAATSQAPG